MIVNQSICKNNITAVILAGGRGERMGGQDKGLVTLWGQPLLAHVIAAISSQVGEIMISANRNLDRYREFGVAVMADEIGEYWGPLAGMATALRAVRTQYLLTLPCDAPCLPADLVDQMRAQLESSDAELCVAHDGKRLQNTIALLPRILTDSIEAFLENGQRKVETWLRQHNMDEVVFSESAGAFVNVNSDEQLRQLERQHRCR